MIRTTLIAATAALTIAAASASPAQALSKKGAFWAGVGAATAFGLAAGAAHGYHGGYYYDDSRAYRRAARRCARRWGWHTWKWERCMRRRGF